MRKLVALLLVCAQASWGYTPPAARLPAGVLWSRDTVGVIGGIPDRTTISATLSPLADVNDFSVKDQVYPSGDLGGPSNSGIGYYSDLNYRAAHFTATASYAVGRVVIRLRKIGAPTGTLRVDIRANATGPATSTTAGAISSTVNLSTLTGGWNDVAFTGFTNSLVNGTQYWVCVYLQGTSNSTNYVQWSMGNTDSTPEPEWYSCCGNNGSAWVSEGGHEMKFRIYDNVSVPHAQYNQDQINNALSAAANGAVVLLNDGTYPCNGTVNIPSNKSLRGTSSVDTKLVFTGGGYAHIKMEGAPINSDAVSLITTWTAGYNQGVTNLTVGSSAGYTVGDLVILDQQNDSTVVDAFGEDHPNPSGGMSNDPTKGHVEMQLTKITAIPDGTHVSVSPGLYMSNWDTAHHPRMMRASPSTGKVVYAGLENLHVEGNSAIYIIDLSKAENCWVKNVDSAKGGTSQMHNSTTLNCEIRHSYFRPNAVIGVGSYSALIELGTRFLYEDNISDGALTGTGAFIFGRGTSGSVVGYNFFYGISNANNTGAIFGNHQPFPNFNLFEGNIAPNITFDDGHGGAYCSTIFRNRLKGTDFSPGAFGPGSTTTGNAHALTINRSNRNYTSAGNVLGTSGRNTTYESYQPTVGWLEGSVYDLAWTTDRSLSNSTFPSETAVYTSLIRHGDYDTATHGIAKWDGGADHTLPNSLYYSSKPAFFGDLAWPAVDPNSGIPADDAIIPAGYRYLNGTDPGAAPTPTPTPAFTPSPVTTFRSIFHTIFHFGRP